MFKNGKLISILFILGIVCSLSAVSAITSDQPATPNKAIVSLTDAFDNSVTISEESKIGPFSYRVKSWTFNKGDVREVNFSKVSNHIMSFKIRIAGYESAFGPYPVSNGLIIKTFVEDCFGWISVTIGNGTVTEKINEIR